MGRACTPESKFSTSSEATRQASAPAEGELQPGASGGRGGTTRQDGGTGGNALGHSFTLHRYLAKDLLLNAVVALFAFEAILGTAATIKVTQEFPIPLAFLIPILSRALVAQLIYALPIAFLFGASLLVGRLHADREITALQSFGVSYRQLLVPIAAFGTVVGGLSYYINHNWVPEARFSLRNVQALILDNISHLGEGWNKEFQFGEQSIWIYHFDGQFLEGILFGLSKDDRGVTERLISPERLEHVDADSSPIFIFAQRGLIVPSTSGDVRHAVELHGVDVYLDCEVLREGDREDPPAGADGEGLQVDLYKYIDRVRINPFTYHPPSADKTRGLKDRPDRLLRSEIEKRRQVLAKIDRKEHPRKWQAAHKRLYEALAVFHRRLALSFCALTFSLAAFALGLCIRSSNRFLPFFVASSVIPALYFSLEIIGVSWAEKGWLPMLTAQLGNAGLLLLCGGALLWGRLPPRRS
jgi:lipopolysaccharide export LptBFGC system permease protein LptF